MLSLIDSIERSDSVREKVLLGLVEAAGIDGRDGDDALGKELTQTVEQIRERWHGKTAGEIPHLRPARLLYRAFGTDPTRYRPSPEALTRRLLRGHPFPRIHRAVDLANLWAVSSGLPVGLYDTDRLASPRIELRVGRIGESYAGIRRPEIHLDGRLVLADVEGPFGNPSADSSRTSVNERTTNCLFVMFTPSSATTAADLKIWNDWLAERVETYLRAATRTIVCA